MTTSYTKQATRVLQLAVQEADGLRHDSVGTLHLLLGLLRGEDAIAASVLRTHGVTYETVLAEVGRTHERGKPGFWRNWRRTRNLGLAKEAQEPLVGAFSAATEHGRELIGPEDVLLGLLHDGHGPVASLLRDLGAPPELMREQVNRLCADRSRSIRE